MRCQGNTCGQKSVSNNLLILPVANIYCAILQIISLVHTSKNYNKCYLKSNNIAYFNFLFDK